jgi:uncharacterized membrane protein required for colicin V production
MTSTGVSWVDLAIIIVIGLSVISGLTQGFFRSVCSLGGLILGLALAEWNYPIVAAPLKGLMHSDELADVLAFILIAIVVMAIAAIIGSILAKTFQKIGLGCLDRLAGAAFGFVQGVLLVTLAILVTVAFFCCVTRQRTHESGPVVNPVAIGASAVGGAESGVDAPQRSQAIIFPREKLRKREEFR